MSDWNRDFRRIVVELHKGYHDEETMRFLADLARTLGLELAARYVLDPGAARAAALPFNREFRVLERDWQPLDQDAVRHAAELSAAAARRRFEQVANAYGISHSFQLLTEGANMQEASGSRDEAVAVLLQRWSTGGPLDMLLKAAFEEAAGVLILPGLAPRRTGPVLVAADSPDDAISAIGARLAAPGKERFVALGSVSSERGEASLYGRSYHTTAAQGAGVREVSSSTRERLIVCHRGAMDDAALSSLASKRGSAVFAIDWRSGHDTR